MDSRQMLKRTGRGLGSGQGMWGLCGLRCAAYAFQQWGQVGKRWDQCRFSRTPSQLDKLDQNTSAGTQKALWDEVMRVRERKDIVY